MHAINKNLKLIHVSCVDKNCIFLMSIIYSIVRSMNCAHLLQCLNDTFDMKKLLANLTADEIKEVLLAHCISKFYTLTDFQDFSNPANTMATGSNGEKYNLNITGDGGTVTVSSGYATTPRKCERRNSKLLGLCEFFSKCPGRCCSWFCHALAEMYQIYGIVCNPEPVTPIQGHDQIKLREHGGDELEGDVVPCSKRMSKILVVERYGQGSYWVR